MTTPSLNRTSGKPSAAKRRCTSALRAQPANSVSSDRSRSSAVGCTTMVVESSRPEPAILEEFVRVAHGIVWCTMATVDRRRRPRSRVVHPLWETSADTVVGWLFTRPTPLKVAHLAHHPYASCSYWSPDHEVAVAECHAEFAED